MVEALLDDWHKSFLRGHSPLTIKHGIKIVMGCPVYTERYVTYFLDYCLPSLMAPRNRAALDAAGYELVLFVDEEGERRMQGLPAWLQVIRIPEPILSGILAEPMYKYRLLAMVHNLLIHKAKDAGAGFHMMVADSVYSKGYFENLLCLAKQHDAIAQTGLVLSQATGLPLLNAYKRKGYLAIPGYALCYITVKHMASQWRGWYSTLDDYDSMPNSHFVQARSRGAVRVYCAHKNATWVSHDRCTRIEEHLGGTIDSELPRYLAGGFYTPQLHDDMICSSFAFDDPVTPRTSWANYKREFWEFIGGTGDGVNNKFLPYFVNPCEFPAPHDESYPESAELDARFQRLMDKLYEDIGDGK